MLGALVALGALYLMLPDNSNTTFLHQTGSYKTVKSPGTFRRPLLKAPSSPYKAQPVSPRTPSRHQGNRGNTNPKNSKNTRAKGMRISSSSSSSSTSAPLPMQGAYLDFGYLYGVGIWDVINWNNNPPTIDPDLATAFYLPILQSVQQAGGDRVYLAFAQLYDMPALAAGTGGLFAPTPDTLGQLYTPPPVYKTPSGDDFLAFFVKLAAGMSPPINVIVSLGGIAACGNSQGVRPWSFPASGASVAASMLQFATEYSLHGYDFDVECTDFFNNASEVTSLLSNLQKSGLFLSYSVLGSAYMDPLYMGVIPYFQVVQLMLYSGAGGPQYVSSCWIQPYLDAPGINGNTRRLSIGFDTDIDYNQFSSCDGNAQSCPCVTPITLSNGQAANAIYQDAISNLVPATPATAFSGTFWWMDQPLNLGDPSSRESQTMKDFWQALSS